MSQKKSSKLNTTHDTSQFVRVRGAQEHNLKNINVDIPRNCLVVFTGISGSGKSSLAFGTLYGEAQRRYLESVSPYARRLFNQMSIPKVYSVEGLPPAVALQQQRGSSTSRSSVGSVTTLANLLRMLYSRAGDYPEGQGILFAEAFSSNSPEGACEQCHGLGKVFSVTEKSMVPDDTLTIRERAVAAWPPAWHGQNLREILMTLGHDVDIPWKDLPQKTKDWILFTKDQPTVPVYSGRSLEEVQKAYRQKAKPSYMGTFTSAERYVMHTYSSTESAHLKKRVSQFMISSVCSKCQGKRLKSESLGITFAGCDITELSSLPLKELYSKIAPFAEGLSSDNFTNHPEKRVVAQRICADLMSRLEVILDMGLGYLTMYRSTPTLSPGELQRLRLATQIRSNLFGVVYVLDEPSAGLHPIDVHALLQALKMLIKAGNSLFVVEHSLDIIKEADWVVDVGPDAGEAGGEILYSGPLIGLNNVEKSYTQQYLFGSQKQLLREVRKPIGQLCLKRISRNNLSNIDVDFPLGVLTSVTGVSGSGKSTLVSQVLVQLVEKELGTSSQNIEYVGVDDQSNITYEGKIVGGIQQIQRLIMIDQKPIGRTPRSNLATYTGLFDQIRKSFAATKDSKDVGFTASRFSFNVVEGRCANCSGEGFVMVELLFLPSVYSTCPLCNGARYNKETLAIQLKGLNISDVLNLTVKEASKFFADDPSIMRFLDVLNEVGLGYIRLGQSATELSGGEAQRVKLASELHFGSRGQTLYVLDEPTTGLHSADVDRLLKQLHGLVEAGNTVIVVEHNMRVVASSDWVIDIGPGAGNEGGKIVAAGTPITVAKTNGSKTGPFLNLQMNNLS